MRRRHPEFYMLIIVDGFTSFGVSISSQSEVKQGIEKFALIIQDRVTLFIKTLQDSISKSVELVMQVKEAQSRLEVHTPHLEQIFEFSGSGHYLRQSICAVPQHAVLSFCSASINHWPAGASRVRFSQSHQRVSNARRIHCFAPLAPIFV